MLKKVTEYKQCFGVSNLVPIEVRITVGSVAMTILTHRDLVALGRIIAKYWKNNGVIKRRIKLTADDPRQELTRPRETATIKY